MTKRISYTQPMGELAVLVAGVPAEICPQCGEQHLALLAVYRQIQNQIFVYPVVIELVVRAPLVKPDRLAGVGLAREDAAGPLVVAGTLLGVPGAGVGGATASGTGANGGTGGTVGGGTPGNGNGVGSQAGGTSGNGSPNGQPGTGAGVGGSPGGGVHRFSRWHSSWGRLRRSR